MSKKRYKTVLFDMDGTVDDTDPLVLEAMNRLYDEYRDGVRTNPKEVVYFSGPPIRETLLKEFPNQDIDLMFKRFSEVSYELYATHTFPYPHSKEVLLELKRDGFQLGIVTNKLHWLTEYALKCIGLDNIFDLIVGYDDVSNAKPHQEGIEKAIKYFNSSREETIYIGDNKSDYLTAINAQVDSVIVNWGPRVLPSEIKPTYRINSYLDLKGVLYEKL